MTNPSPTTDTPVLEPAQPAPLIAGSPARGAGALIVTGNANVGKSVIFQLLTGRYATVSNYPGTTVAVTSGRTVCGGTSYRVSDTPGLNSLHATSEDELVARDLILRDHATVLHIADAKTLPRALALALDLAEANVPAILVLNMMDEARERRIRIDEHALRDWLGIPVVATIATQRVGLDRLRRAIPQAAPVRQRVQYPPCVEMAIAAMTRWLPTDGPGVRALAVLWLSGDEALQRQLSQRLDAVAVAELQRVTAEAQAQSAVPLAQVISEAKARTAQRIAAHVMTTPAQPLARFQWWGRVAMHPVWGFAILAAVLSLMYFLVGDLAAQRGVGFLEEIVFARYITPANVWVVQHLLPWPAWQAPLIGEYGLLTMALPYAFAIILPIVSMFFLCFGLIEDVGYLPRLAVMAHRGCRLLGLNGKAVLPLVLGLGCDTMATMTTRILETRRERLLVIILLAVGVPCSAQLGVIMAMLAGQPVALTIWLGVVSGVIVVVGRLAARLIPGEQTPFIYEIPPLRRPQLSNVLIKTLGRVEWYVREAVPLFFLGTAVLYVLDATGVLRVLEHLGAPLVTGWLGLPVQTTAAFLVGFLRRDFGAAGLYVLQRDGVLSPAQIITSLVTITLFVPCIAQYFMMVKERGWRQASAIAGFATALALVVGGIVSHALRGFGW